LYCCIYEIALSFGLIVGKEEEEKIREKEEEKMGKEKKKKEYEWVRCENVVVTTTITRAAMFQTRTPPLAGPPRRLRQ
jgi:hypothetical protein